MYIVGTRLRADLKDRLSYPRVFAPFGKGHNRSHAWSARVSRSKPPLFVFFFFMTDSHSRSLLVREIESYRSPSTGSRRTVSLFATDINPMSWMLIYKKWMFAEKRSAIAFGDFDILSPSSPPSSLFVRISPGDARWITNFFSTPPKCWWLAMKYRFSDTKKLLGYVLDGRNGARGDCARYVHLRGATKHRLEY